MKQTLAIMAALAMTGVALNCYADGAIYLNNYDANNPVYYLDAATKATASGTFVQILNGTTQLAKGELVEDGFFDFGYGVIAGADTTTDVSVTVNAWREGADYASAKFAATASWSQKAGAVPALPAVPTPTALAFPGNFIIKEVGTTPVVPEPSTIALALLGGAALMLRRRN